MAKQRGFVTEPEKFEKKWEYTDLIVEKDYPVGRIVINRPQRRNSITVTLGGTKDQLEQAFDDMRIDPEIRAFELTGAGPCFCSGFDMSTFPAASSKKEGREKEALTYISARDPNNPEVKYRQMRWQEGLWDNPTPSVAVVRSFCLGWGLCIASQCDIVYATPDAVFGYPPIRYGAAITIAILQPWILGLRKTMQMGLTGHCITAEGALNCGLITEIVPDDKIDEEARKVCESIAKVPPMTNFVTKMVVHQYFEDLGMKRTEIAGHWASMMTEQSSIPGHYWDFFALVREKGFTEAYKEQRAKWGYPDPVMDREIARLKSLKEGKMKT